MATERDLPEHADQELADAGLSHGEQLTVMAFVEMLRGAIEPRDILSREYSRGRSIEIVLSMPDTEWLHEPIDSPSGPAWKGRRRPPQGDSVRALALLTTLITREVERINPDHRLSVCESLMLRFGEMAQKLAKAR